MKLKHKIKTPKELLEQALGNNAEPVQEYPDIDEVADMQIKEMAERWDR